MKTVVGRVVNVLHSAIDVIVEKFFNSRRRKITSNSSHSSPLLESIRQISDS